MNDAEKLLIKIAGGAGAISVALLAWMALTLYSTNAMISSLRQRVVDQTSSTDRRLDRMQIDIDKNSSNIERLEGAKWKQE